MRLNRQKGFSLVELLLVVAIIMVLAAISIPNMVASRIAANEAGAVASIRSINTAQTGYSINYPQLGYSDNLLKLSDPPAGQPVSSAHGGFLDWVLGCAKQPCARTGYFFAIVDPVGAPGVITSYKVTAIPASREQTGRRGFCGSDLTTIKFDPNGGSNCILYIQ